MRVVVLLNALFDWIGGIETFNRCLVKALDELAAKRGWHVRVLVHADRDKPDFVTQYMTPARMQYQGFSRDRVRFFLTSLREALKADITIFGHVHHAALGLPLSVLRPRGRRYLMVYGLDVARRLPFLRRSGASRMSKILSISAFTAEQMQEYNPIPDGRFVLVPCTLDPFYGKNSTPQPREALGLPCGKMILTVSRLDVWDQHKGIDMVVRALPEVLSQVPDAFHVLVGDGSDRARLESLVADLGLTSHVYFAGRVSDSLLPSYYQQCDIFVMPSTGEGFGIVFLEAMHHAKPCIGARAGGIPEVIEDGKTGFLVEPGDQSALVGHIVNVLGDARLRSEMGQCGRARSEERFSFQQFRDRLERVLCE